MSSDDITPTLEQVIKNAIEGRLTDVHTALPGEILSYDSTKQVCSVQPCIMRKYVNGKIVKIPVINSVPVIHPRSGSAIIHLPLKAGDKVLLIFAERSIDIWKSAGGCVDPLDTRKHHFSDAIAIPGLYPISAPITVPDPNALTILNGTARMEIGTDSMKFVHPNAEIHFNPDGTIKIMNSAQGVELMDLLTRLVQAIIDARTETLLGPQPLINLGADAFPALKALLDKLKG